MIANNSELAAMVDNERKKKTYEVLLEAFKSKLEEWSVKFKEALPMVFGAPFIEALERGLQNVKVENITNDSKTIENTVVVHKFNMDKIDNSIAMLAESQKSQLDVMNKQTDLLGSLKDALSKMQTTVVNNVVQPSNEENNLISNMPFRKLQRVL